MKLTFTNDFVMWVLIPTISVYFYPDKTGGDVSILFLKFCVSMEWVKLA